MEVLATPQREDVLRLLRAHEAELHELGVLSLQLFGSVARDEATPNSDIDCLVEFSKPIGLFGFSQIRLFLENLLKYPVDMGTQAALKEHLRQPALEDLVHVF